MIIAVRGIQGNLFKFSTVRLNKNTTHAPYGQYNAMRCYTTPNQLGFETDRESGRLKQRDFGLKEMGNTKGGNQSNIMGRPWTTLPK